MQDAIKIEEYKKVSKMDYSMIYSLLNWSLITYHFLSPTVSASVYSFTYDIFLNVSFVDLNSLFPSYFNKEQHGHK